MAYKVSVYQPTKKAIRFDFYQIFPLLITTRAWVEKGGIVGRGILLDYAAWASARNINCLDTHKITISDLKQVAEAQNTTILPNDILLIRSGFIKALTALSPSEAVTYATTKPTHAIGIDASEEMLKWLWEREFSAVGGDMPAFEALPIQSKEFWIHEWLLPGWGLPIGELFDLETLSAECKRLGKWSFFFSSMPLKVSSSIPCVYLLNSDSA
jgi:kynurenine formamidase